MTRATATATAAAGTKGRKVTLTFADGRELTFGDKNSAFLAIVTDADGVDVLTNGSATRKGAENGEGARGVRNGVWTNLAVIEVA